MIKAVIFDLDDTLYPEKEYVLSGFNAIAKFISNQTYLNSTDIYKKLIELSEENPKQVFNRLIEAEEKFRLISVKDLIEVYRNHYPSIKLYDDALKIFEHLKTNNVKLGIITDGYKETQKQKIDSLCLKDIIDEIVITDELGKQYWKPHKLPFEVIVKKMSIDFDEMIYVGDNPTKDFYIGSIYPIRTVRILREGYYLDKEYFKGIKENYRITTLSELLNIIKAINRMEGE